MKARLNFPEPDRFWRIIDKYGVTILYTAPSAIRAFMKWGVEWPKKHESIFSPFASAPWRAHQSGGMDLVQPGSSQTKAVVRLSIPGGQTETGGILIYRAWSQNESTCSQPGRFFGILPEWWMKRQMPSDEFRGETRFATVAEHVAGGLWGVFIPSVIAKFIE